MSKFQKKIETNSSVRLHRTGTLCILAMIVVLMIIFCFSIYNIILWQQDSDKINNIMKEVISSFDSNEISKLKSKNADTIGWIKVPETKIDYPIVQTKDNDYYLTNSFDKKSNQAGWIFVDYRNNIKDFDDNTIIYGHGLVNGLMFGSLKNTLEKNWQANIQKQNIIFNTEAQITQWQIFSVYHIKTTDDYLEYSFNNSDEFNKFISLINNRSAYDFKNKPNQDDKILTLSTCFNDSERIVVHAKLVKQEPNNH